MAAKSGHAECVKLLIPVSDASADNSAALQQAARFGCAECVKLLIPVSDPEASHSAAFRHALKSGDEECFRLLISTAALLADQNEILADLAMKGNAKNLSDILAREPLFLDGLDLFRLQGSAASLGHAELARLFASIIEKNALAASLPPPNERAAAPRL